VAELILGIVVDILGHVPIQLEQAVDVGLAPAAPWHFAVLDATEFVALLLQVAFDDFDRGQEPEYGHVSLCETATPFLGKGRQRRWLLLLLHGSRYCSVGVTPCECNPMTGVPVRLLDGQETLAQKVDT